MIHLLDCTCRRTEIKKILTQIFIFTIYRFSLFGERKIKIIILGLKSTRIVKLSLSISLYLSFNLSICLYCLSLRDRDRADTITTLYHHTTPHHHKLLKCLLGDLYSSVIHHWNRQLKPYSFPLRKNRVNQGHS